MLYNTDQFRDNLLAISGAKEQAISKILYHYPRGSGLSAATSLNLQNCGLTALQARRVMAAFGMVRAIDSIAQDVNVMDVLKSPKNAVSFVRERVSISDLKNENFWIIGLDSRSRPLELFKISQGSLSSVDVHPRELFAPLMRGAVYAAIMVHNHPSGDCEPSEADLDITKRMKEVGLIIGIPIMDHLIITSEDYFSFQVNGII